MKYLKQFSLILLISFIGELLNYVLPLPIPASIYGIILLFVGLLTGIIPLASVRETGLFLIEIMPIMFIPAAVGLLNSWGMIAQSWLPYLVTTFAITVGVMAVAGRVTQMIIRMKNKKTNAKEAK